MTLLSIETSCDETSAAILVLDDKKQYLKLLSNVVATSLPLHKETGGIIPENAAREQLKYIIPVINEAMQNANISEKEIDRLSVTIGPGLIGSLLVGVETIKTFGYIWKKRIIPVNHLFGHIYANYIDRNLDEIKFPAVALVVSGGHTDLVLIKSHSEIKWLGGTRDDAAGEALDKTGRLLGLDYPAGPKIEELAKTGNDIFNFPRPLYNSNDYDFSFSGLKTAVFNQVHKINDLNNQVINDICASVQTAIIDILIHKTFKAINEYGAKSLLIGGGVAANSSLKSIFKDKIENDNLKISLFIPEKKFCTDNAAMIGAAALLMGKDTTWDKVKANPELYFD